MTKFRITIYVFPHKKHQLTFINFPSFQKTKTVEVYSSFSRCFCQFNYPNVRHIWLADNAHDASPPPPMKIICWNNKHSVPGMTIDMIIPINNFDHEREEDDVKDQKQRWSVRNHKPWWCVSVCRPGTANTIAQEKDRAQRRTTTPQIPSVTYRTMIYKYSSCVTVWLS